MLSCYFAYSNLRLHLLFSFCSCITLHLYHTCSCMTMLARSLQIHFAYIMAQYGLLPSSYIHIFDLSYPNIAFVHVDIHSSSFYFTSAPEGEVFVTPSSLCCLKADKAILYPWSKSCINRLNSTVLEMQHSLHNTISQLDLLGTVIQLRPSTADRIS